MKAVIQRVTRAQVAVAGKIVSEIDAGLVTLLGIEKGDDERHLEKMIQKICNLRIFSDAAGKMNLSLLDVKGVHLIVSQFTLAGDTSSGRRPSFVNAEHPDRAKALYEKAILLSQAAGVETRGGIFQADMQVSLTNDGPVTFILEISE